MINVKEALFELSRLPGPSGYEGGVAEKALELLREVCDNASGDRVGNVTGVIRCGIENAPKVLLDAHLDEVGVMVTGEDKGFYSFRTLGGIDPRIFPGAEITLFAPEPVKAVVACLPPHILKPEDSDKSQPTEDLFLDTGGVKVRIGTIGVYATEPREIGPYWCGKAFDDRSCFAVILRAAELLDRDKLRCDVYLCGSAQEEVGGRGACVSAYNVYPDYAIAVDVSFGTSPDCPKDKAFPLGGGVIIGHGPDCNRKIASALRELARAKEIPHQIDVDCSHSGTNATDMQVVRRGVATGVLSIPLRYMHTPREILHPEDIESAAKLIREWVMTIC